MASWSDVLTKSKSNAPINVIPHLPPPGRSGGNGGDLTFEKSNSPPTGEQLVVKSPCSIAGINFRRQINSHSSQAKANA